MPPNGTSSSPSPEVGVSDEDLLLAAEIGGRLKEERERLSLGVAEFAALGGLKRLAQQRYEAGKRIPDALFLARLDAAQVGADVQYILTGRRERRTRDVTTQEREWLDRVSTLNPKLRELVEGVLLVCYLAHQARQDDLKS
jgi:transcriptional regulator with XRE-family HTH domain